MELAGNQRTQGGGRVKAVIFDMDGLMFDTERLTRNAWLWAGKKLGYTDLGQILLQALGRTIVSTKELFYQQYGTDFPFEEMVQLGSVYRSRYLQEYGVPLKPGLMELLHFLKNMGCRTAVATSTSCKSARPLLQEAGVVPFINEFVYGDALPRSKPAPDIYLLALRLLAVPPEECLALEDSPNGIRSASAAGIRAVMVPDLVKPEESLESMLYACVEDLSQVIPLLENA